MHLLAYLGRGVSGTVYRAYSKAYHGCAFKTGPLDSLRREAEMLEHLHHPNIVSLYAQGSMSPSEDCWSCSAWAAPCMLCS